MISVLRYLRVSSALGGGDINGISLTTASCDYSESFAPGNMDKVGIIFKGGDTLSGDAASLTVDIALWMSPDGGTTWCPAPAADNASTGAALTQIAASSTIVGEFWPLFLSESGQASNPLYRFAFTYGGATTTVEGAKIWLVQRKFNQRHP